MQLKIKQTWGSGNKKFNGGINKNGKNIRKQGSKEK